MLQSPPLTFLNPDCEGGAVCRPLLVRHGQPEDVAPRLDAGHRGDGPVRVLQQEPRRTAADTETMRPRLHPRTPPPKAPAHLTASQRKLLTARPPVPVLPLPLSNTLLRGRTSLRSGPATATGPGSDPSEWDEAEQKERWRRNET